MAKNISFCELIKQIQADPFKKIEGLTISYFGLLKQHLQECEACSKIVNEILEKYKEIPKDSNSDWENTKYN
jgi:hypothetical protein